MSGHEKASFLFSGGKELATRAEGSRKDAMRDTARNTASFLRSIPPAMRPRLVRGDVGFGNEAVVLSCEQAGEPYLFKVRRSRGERS